MAKSIRYSLGFIALFTLLIFSILYYISIKLSSDDIQSFLTSVIETSLPGTLVSINRVSYSVGLSLNIEIQELDIKLKKNRPGSELFFVKKAFIRTPVWAIFFTGGKSDIIIDSPRINYYEYRDSSNNWNSKKALKIENLLQRIIALHVDKDSYDATSLPALLSRGRVNIRSNDITVFYQTKEDLQGEFSISRFLVKNISLSESMAFEIQSSIKMALQKELSFSSNILLVGEFAIPGVLEKNLFKSKVEARLTNGQLTGLGGGSFSIPDSRADVALATKGSDLAATLKLDVGELVDDLKANIIWGKVITINDLQANFDLASVLEMGGINPKNFRLSGVKAHVSGSIRLDKRPVLNLKFQSTKNIRYTLLKNPIDIKFSGTVNRRNVTLNIPLETISGTGEISAKTILPRDIMATSWKNLSRTELDMKFERMKILEGDVQQLLRLFTKDMTLIGNRVKEYPVSVEERNRIESGPLKQLFVVPDFKLRLFGSKVAIGNFPFWFRGSVVAQDNSFQSQDFSIDVGPGPGNMKTSFTINFGQDLVVTKFKIDMKKIPFKSLHPFFSDRLKKLSGATNTKLVGSITSTEEKLAYDIKTNLSIAMGEIKNLGMNEFIENYINNVSVLKQLLDKEKANFSDQFKHFVINGRFREDHYQMDKIDFVGMENEVRIKGRGNLFPLSEKKKGVIFLTFEESKNELGNELKKNIGIDIIPMRLDGIGFDLKPDYSYTVNGIAKAMLKSKKSTRRKRNKKRVKKRP